VIDFKINRVAAQGKTRSAKQTGPVPEKMKVDMIGWLTVLQTLFD
jgi:hypothetical protein